MNLVREKIGMRLTEKETKKANMLAEMIDCSPHEWPKSLDEVALVCHGYLDRVADNHELRTQLAAVEAERDAAQKRVQDGETRMMRYAIELAEMQDERDAALAEAAKLRYVLRKAIEAAGGVAQEGVSDAFLTLVPAEVGALKHKCGKLEAALLAAQAGEARAREALERVVVELREEANKFEAMANNHFTHGEAYGWREACRRVVGVIGDKNISALAWLDQREREAAAVELERIAGGSLLALGIAAVRDWLRDRAANLRAGKVGINE